MQVLPGTNRHSNDLAKSENTVPKSQSQMVGRRPSWLADALTALDQVDDEVKEDDLPVIDKSTKEAAARIINALARPSFGPTIYPTQDGEIAIQFKSPVQPSSMVILLNNSGQVDCYAHTGGRNWSAHYDASDDVPDHFLTEQLGKLMSV